MDADINQNKAIGGRARAEALTAERRKEIARNAARTRWNSDLPQVSHQGDLTIGENIVLPCYVLEDGTRVLSRIGMLKAIGRQGKAKGGRQHDSEFQIPVFLTANNLKPFIPEGLLENSTQVVFGKGALRIIGYKAEFLPKVCEVFLDARDAGKLRANQLHIAEACKILHRAFATVGIIALVDEATGYQEVRDREALQAILNKYLTDEWAKWTKTFPDSYYQELFRLKGIEYPGTGTNRPRQVGHWTNDIVYSRLQPGILKELKKKNPAQGPEGRRLRKHHQHFTSDYGKPELRDHLSNVVFLMKACNTWSEFKERLDRAAAKYGDNIPLPLG